MAGSVPNEPGGSESVAEAARAARIAGARADFMASLGRRTAELRTSLRALEQEPASSRARDVLRRRVHALAAGAKLLRFAAMAAALAEAEALLAEAARANLVRTEDIATLDSLFETLPSLAWGDPRAERQPTDRPPPAAPLGETRTVAPFVLLVGPPGFAAAIADPPDSREAAQIECESCGLEQALDRAHAFSPDVVVIDADLSGASALLQQLRSDAQGELPVVVVGSFSNPEQAGSWLAAGASRALAKPLSPASLQTACKELAAAPKPFSTYAPLGEITVEELTRRLAEEIRRGLCEAVTSSPPSTRIPLGPGAEVLAAIWAAVARVREIVTIKTEGAVRFSPSGPEGALPLALWWNSDSATGDRQVANGAGRGESEAMLEGRSVVVADDDPAVAWFLASVLRAAGARVFEAHDGDRALSLCIGRAPDLVISDVLMPGLDGFALCRALKRDIALRDVPVLLLSWKEDLLQRLRELGAAADGYLRKEASAAVILQRASEVLRPRMRIEARLRAPGEVRGRLDGITPRSLLEMVSRLRPNARVCIHDASFLYEVELREGAPRSATRTTSQGVFQRGSEILGAMLGARAGRFSVSQAEGPVRGALNGSLRVQMALPVARARAAVRLLGGTRLLEVHRVVVDMEGVLPYLGATPDSARALVERVASGDSPRTLILGGEVAPTALEEVLCDLAAHGAVRGVRGASGDDLLDKAVEDEMRVLEEAEAQFLQPRRTSTGPRSVVESSQDGRSPSPRAPFVMSASASAVEASEVTSVPTPTHAGASAPLLVREEAAAAVPASAAAAVPSSAAAAVPLTSVDSTSPGRENASGGAALATSTALIERSRAGDHPPPAQSPDVPAELATAVGSVGSGPDELASFDDWGASPRNSTGSELDRKPPQQSSRGRNADPDTKEEVAPTSLEAAVIREISDFGSDVPSSLRKPSAAQPPSASIVDARALRARTAGVQKIDSDKAPSEQILRASSLPPDAVVPEGVESLESRAAGAGGIDDPSAAEVPPGPGVPGAASALIVRPESSPTKPREEGSPPRPRREAGGHSGPEVPGRDRYSTWLLGAAGFLVGTGMLLFAVHFGLMSAGPSRSRSPSVGQADESPARSPGPVAPPLTERAAKGATEWSSPLAEPSARLPEGARTSAHSPAPPGAPSGATSSASLVETSSSAVPAANGSPGGSPPVSAADDLPLPNGVRVGSDQGLLEIETGGRDSIFVDGAELGRGPALRVALAPGVHEVRVKVGGEDRVRFVLIRSGRLARLFGSPSSTR